MKSQGRLLQKHMGALSPGRVEWIGLRPARRQAMLSVSRVNAIVGQGLEGDHRCLGRPESGRQVSLIALEHIDATASLLGMDFIDPALLRRNIVTTGINPNLIRHHRIRIGTALLEANALCHPCARMNEALGPNGVAMMFGHGGICCRILEPGCIALGDEITVEAG